MLAHRFHHVYRYRAVSFGERQCPRHFAIERNQIDVIDGGLVARALGLIEEIRMMMAQVDARHRSHRAGARHRTREPVCGHANSHASLDDGQQLAPLQTPAGQRGHAHGFAPDAESASLYAAAPSGLDQDQVSGNAGASGQIQPSNLLSFSISRMLTLRPATSMSRASVSSCRTREKCSGVMLSREAMTDFLAGSVTSV